MTAAALGSRSRPAAQFTVSIDLKPVSYATLTLFAGGYIGAKLKGSCPMLNLRLRSAPRPPRHENPDHKPERPLPSVFVRKLESDLAHHDKLARAFIVRRPG